jgi:hypothetical protein
LRKTGSATKHPETFLIHGIASLAPAMTSVQWFKPKAHDPAIAFSSEVDTGLREENASKQKARARF